MELTDLVPEKATISKTFTDDNDQEHNLELTFRPFSVEDEAWLKRAYGDRLKEVFDTMDMASISRIGFHQLTVTSKRALMKIKFVDIDEENGEEKEVHKTGHQKLGAITTGYPAQVELIQALLKTRGFSMPIIEELGDHIVNEVEGAVKKKKSKARKKK